MVEINKQSANNAVLSRVYFLKVIILLLIVTIENFFEIFWVKKDIKGQAVVMAKDSNLKNLTIGQNFQNETFTLLFIQLFFISKTKE